MPSFFNSVGKDIVSPLFSTNYWIGFAVSIAVISTLFIFKSFYAKVSKYNSFRYTLGVTQLLLYVTYFLFHQLSGDITWKDYMPFQLCSVLDLASGILLIFPSEKLFSMTFPLVAPVVIVFLLPDATKWVYGLNNFFYYQYYFHHIIILFGYFYLYLYGHIKYNKMLLKETITGLVFFGIFVYLFNTSFDTNYLFIGDIGYHAAFGNYLFNTGAWLPIFRFGFMFGVGLFFLIPLHFSLVKWFKPYYLNKGSEVNPYYKNKKNFIKKITLKWNARINKNKSVALEIEEIDISSSIN